MSTVRSGSIIPSYRTRLSFGRFPSLFACCLSFRRCHQQHVAEEEERVRRRAKVDEQWALLEELALLKAGE